MRLPITSWGKKDKVHNTNYNKMFNSPQFTEQKSNKLFAQCCNRTQTEQLLSHESLPILFMHIKYEMASKTKP